MTIKTFFTAAILAMLPAFASASCGWQSQQAMTCAEGSVYDAETGTCTVVTG